MRLAIVTASQKRLLSTVQKNCLCKNFLIPQVSQRKRKGNRGRTDRGHDQQRPYKGCQITHTTYKYFHRHNTCLFDDQTVHYRHLRNTIPLSARMVTAWFCTYIVCLSGEHGIATFVYCCLFSMALPRLVTVCLVSMALPCVFIPTFVYQLYPLIRPISIVANSCNRITSVSCLWRNPVGIGIPIIADMPLTFRIAILCVPQ